MSTAILRPVADGATKQLTPSTGTVHYALVDEVTADDTDYLSNLAGYSQFDLLTLGTLSLPDGAVITKVTATVRCKATTSGSLYVRLINTAGTGILIPIGTVPPTSWGDVVSKDIRLCPSTGQSWAAADLSGKTLNLWCNSGDASFKISQAYITVYYFIPATGTTIEYLRPNADKAISALNPYPASPTTRYDKIDEATEDTADYCYTTTGVTLSTFELTGSALVGAIDHLRVKAKIKFTTASTTANLVGLALNESTDANVPQAARQDNVEFQAEAIFDTNPGTGSAWAWSDIPALFVGLKLGTGSTGYVYQLWVEVYYKPPVYFDGIVCNSAGGGYVAVSGVLRSDASTPAYKQAQVASDSGFATILGDSTELAATETPGNPMVITFTWTPASAGTYYARLGVRASGEATLTWITLTFTVTFPAVSGISVAQAGEHATITVTVTDNYMDPPEVTIFIDGQAVKGQLN